MQFLQSPGNLDRPAVVTEVAADLSHDRGHPERNEIRSGVDVKAHHRVDQSDPGYLNQVVARFAPALEPASDVIGQGQAPLHDLFPLPLEFH